MNQHLFSFSKILSLKQIWCLWAFFPFLISAKVSLPSILNDGMILQQNTEVRIWGTADSEAEVTISPSWMNKTYQVTPDVNGNWSVKVQTYPADFKKYTMKISHKGTSETIHDIMFGEVWLCSGQSNMEMKMRGWYGSPIIGGREAIANSKNDHIRFFTVAHKLSATEKDDCRGEWQKACPATTSNTSATAYFFGRQLYQTLNVPVALVLSHWGGASIVAFMSGKTIGTFSEYKNKIPVQNAPDDKLDIFTPTAIYNSMIKPVEGYSMRGVIWYQGETDRKIPDLYRKLFRSMLQSWRDKWEVGDFPFIYAQVAPFDYPNETGNSAYIREAQLMCQKECKNAYMVSLTDLGEEHNIHPSKKEDVGFRMAAKALDKVYEMDGICSDEPMYKSMEVKDGKAILSFENAQGGFTSFGKPISDFTIAGADKVFYPAKAWFSGNKIVVTSDQVPEPVAVRYAFVEYAEGCVYNIEGCCASSFRTDNWKDEECQFK